MAEKKTIELEVKSNLGGSISELKALKKELKNAAVGSEDFKRIFNQIDDLEDKIKSAKNTSSDWVDSLENAGGPLGMLGASINKAKVATQSFGGALKATGIGLIVALLGGLAAAFSENEGAMKKLQPLLDGIAKIFQGVFRAVEPLFNTLVDLAVSALPMVSKAFGTVYSVLTATLQSFGAIGSAIGKLIKGDFAGAWESAKGSVTNFGKNYNDSLKRFEEGTKELTKSEKLSAEERQKIRDKEIADKLAKDAKDKAAREKALADKKKEDEAYIQATLDRLKKEQEIKDGADAVLKEFELADKKAKEEDRQADVDAQIQAGKTLQTQFEKRKAISEADRALTLADKNAKIQAAEEVVKTLDGVANLLGKSTIAGKAAAVASATISTFLSAQKAYESTVGIPIVGPVLAPINAGLAIAGGLKSIKSILAVKVPNGGGGGGSVPSVQAPQAGQTQSATPQFNVVGTSGANQIAQTLGNQAPVKAYVVSNDVTTAQSLDRNIVKTATLGG